jgi:PAS domain S-box-containing protein
MALDLISIQADGKIVYINTAGAKMLGATTPGQLVGKPMLDFVHPDYYEIAAERERQMTAKRFVLCPNKERWIRLDGRVITVEVAALRITYEGKSAVQLIVREDCGDKSYEPARHWRFAIRSRRK